MCQLSELSNNTEQLICCLHGPAGSGKSTVIELVLLYAQEYSLYLPNVMFCHNTIVVTAMSGVTATLICRETMHGALFLNQKCEIEPEQIELWADTCLLIIDEISFVSKSDFQMIHKQLGKLKQEINKKFSGLNIIFPGDFWQLEPVGRGKFPIYKDDCPYFIDWVNCYIELNGMHRFKKDVSGGKLLMRMQRRELTKEDVEFINTKVVTGNKSIHLPKDIRYITYFNRDRDAINMVLFEECCARLRCHNVSIRDTLIILADKLATKTSHAGNYETFHNWKIFWENCGEDDIKFPRECNGRMDPLLKLYKGCQLKLVFNNNVRHGEANGTTVTLISICLKPNIVPIIIIIGKLPVKAIYASQVVSIVLKHNKIKKISQYIST